MQIDRVKFGAVFARRVAEMLEEKPRVAVAPSEPRDLVEWSKAKPPSVPTLSFENAVLALAGSAALGGIPALAALSQEVAKDLVTRSDEQQYSDLVQEQFSSLPQVVDPRVDRLWDRVEQMTNSPFPAPRVLQSVFVDAQSDSLGMYLGTDSLDSSLSDDSILAFTLAHEEAHRRHRDSAGGAGLDALYELAKDDDQLGSLAFRALRHGRQANEFAADLFAARVLSDLGLPERPVVEFLASLPGDLQHPEGRLRARLVEESLASRGPLETTLQRGE